MKSTTIAWLSRILFSLSFAAWGLSVNAADWSYDFDSPAPASWTTGGRSEPSSGSTPGTFSAVIESGYLRLSDSVAANPGEGTFTGFGVTTDDVFTDVIVKADLNVATDSDDDLGVFARADVNTGSGYFGSVDYELGEACITKVQEFNIGTDLVCSPDGSLTIGVAHHAELTVVGGAAPNLKLDVFNATGTLLQTINATDDGSVLGGPYASGVAGVMIVPKGTLVADAALNTINGTFDNVMASVPEPTSSLLLLVSGLGLLGFRRRNR